MPKRKATTKLSGLVGSDDDDLMLNGDSSAPEPDERPAKRARGRPAAKSAEDKAEAPAQEPVKKKRGRPKGGGGVGGGGGEGAEQQESEQKEEASKEPKPKKTKAQSKDVEVASDEDVEPAKKDTSKSTKSAKDTKPAATRGRKKANTEPEVQHDDEFEYTPKSRRTKSPPRPNVQTEQPKKGRKAEPKLEPEVEHTTVPESQQPEPDVVQESFLPDLPAPRRSVSASPTKADFRRRPSLGFSPQKRKAGEDGKAEPELRRKIGELTRKCETLENRFRNLREIGVVEANSNVDKLRKQCETITTASDNLVNSLREELASQKALGQQTRQLQKQLGDRDAEVAALKSQAGEATSQLSSAQTEVKALQTKLSAARNTTASLESAAAKAPGSAIKGGNRANAAASAEVAQAAQFAQLKEDLYSDLTGLIIRDVKKGDTENLYDCIQTGANGTLHFKLSVPHVSAADFESAEFQYIPLLNEDRDRDLVAILPEYLTVEITFSRQQASKFYARVIDTLTKRRSSSGSG